MSVGRRLKQRRQELGMSQKELALRLGVTPAAVSKLVATANRTEINADNQSLIYVEVDVTDANGNLKTTATNNITFTVEGPAEIAAVDNGDQATVRKYQNSYVLTDRQNANINAYATGSVSAALGYSRDIFEGLRVGAKVRVIAPVAYAALNLENMRVSTAKDKWTIQTEGYMYAAMQGLEMNIPQDESALEVNFDMDRFLQNKAIAGMGGSLDLGAEYVLNVGSAVDGLTVSASITDLGLISYKTDAVQGFSTSGKIEWVGFQDLSIDNHDFEALIEDFVNSAKEQLNVKEENNISSFTRSTMPRVYAGVEMPFLRRKMSVGLLYSGRFSHSYYRQELTASYNLKPAKWFALGLNYSFLNTGRTMGAILELTPKAGFNLCLGCDYIPMAYASAPILSDKFGIPESMSLLPLSMRLNLHFGLSIALGGDRYKIAE